MRKTLCLVFLGCALVVGLACSGDSTTPTAPAASPGLQITTGESGDKIYLCHGDKSSPYGVVVEVGDEWYKRHSKHIANNRDCICPDDSVAGEQCDLYNQTDYCYYNCPSNE